MSPITISRQTERRFILGKQGLWPGRRWAGLEGTAAALLAIEALQLDPLNVAARSQDIALYSRVLDYRPEYLYQVLYEQRLSFDYGGGLFVYPMAELPCWRVHMRRHALRPGWAEAVTPALLDEMRAVVRERGPVGNRDFTGRASVQSYRGRKDSSLALYHLWLTGELMIHHRAGFERVYDLRERVAPAHLDYAASDAEAETYFERKPVAFLGLVRAQGWRLSYSDYINRPVDRAEAQQRLACMVERGDLAEVRVEGNKEIHYMLSGDLPLLAELNAGRVPAAWQPLGSTTDEEVVFLAPLEIVSARGRAARLFDFEYLWEVYKPAHQRRWGYYNLPVLYGDRLVARIDPRLDRATGTLHINGFWPDDAALAEDAGFVAAFSRGLARFAGLCGAQRVNLDVVAPGAFRAAMAERVNL